MAPTGQLVRRRYEKFDRLGLAFIDSNPNVAVFLSILLRISALTRTRGLWPKNVSTLAKSASISIEREK